MTKQRFGGAGWSWPEWPRMFQFNTAAPSLTTSGVIQLDAANERAALIGNVMWADGETHNVSAIRFRTANATTPNLTLRASLRDVSLVAGPPGRDDGTVDQSATQVNPVANTNYQLTLGATRAVTQGELLAVCFDVDTYTSGAINIAAFAAYTATGVPHRPLFSTFLASTWAIGQTAIPAVSLIADDGTVGILANAFPAPSAAINTHAINTGTSPDEIAIAFTVDAPCYIGGAGAALQVAANGDFDVVLYEGTTARATVSVISDTLNADATVRPIDVAFPDWLCEPGTTYYLAIKPTTANNVTLYSMDVSSAAELEAFAGSAHYASRVDGGAWTPVTTRLPMAWLKVTALEDAGAAAASGADAGIVFG